MEMLVHGLFYLMQLAAQGQRMQWRPHLNSLCEVTQCARYDKLRLSGDSGQTEAFCRSSVAWVRVVFGLGSLEELLGCLLSCHVTRGHVDRFASS